MLYKLNELQVKLENYNSAEIETTEFKKNIASILTAINAILRPIDEKTYREQALAYLAAYDSVSATEQTMPLNDEEKELINLCDSFAAKRIEEEIPEFLSISDQELASIDNNIINILAQLAEAHKNTKIPDEFRRIGEETQKQAEALIYTYSSNLIHRGNHPGFYAQRELARARRANLGKIEKITKHKTIEPHAEAALKQTLILATEVLNNPADIFAITRLEENIKAERPARWKQLLSTLSILVGFALLALAMAAIITTGAVFPLVGCIVAAVGMILLITAGYDKVKNTQSNKFFGTLSNLAYRSRTRFYNTFSSACSSNKTDPSELSMKTPMAPAPLS